MEVIAHDRVGGQYESKAVFGFAKTAFEDFDHMFLSQVGDAWAKLDRDMHPVGSGDRGS